MNRREILFRGKRLDGTWAEGYYVFNGETHGIVDSRVFPGSWSEVDPATIGQYTGLTDKNGVKIWEGDILHFQTYEGGGFGKVGLDAYSVVCYGKHNLSGNHTLGRTIGFYLDRNYDSDVSIYYWIESHKATVVGNRFDTPELTQQS